MITEFIPAKDQISELRQHAHMVLGCDKYKSIDDFYNSVISAHAMYRVTITDRCFNLMHMFYWCQDKHSVDFSSLFYSEDAFHASIPSIANYYAVFGKVPNIILVVDMLSNEEILHSCINRFISAFCEYLNQHGLAKSYEEIECEVLCFLKIRILFAKERQPKLKRTCDHANSVLYAHQYNDMLLCISRLLAESEFPSIAQTLVSNDIDQKFISERMTELGFSVSRRTNHQINDVWIKPVYRNDGELIALYILGLNQNSANNKFNLVPFVITSEFDIAYLQSIATTLEIDKVEGVSYTPSLFQFILSYNLVLLVLQDYPGDLRIARDRIFSTTGDDECTRLILETLLTMQKPFLNWEQFDTLILKATEKANPLVVGKSRNHLSIEEIIAVESMQEASVEFMSVSSLFSRISTLEDKFIDSIADVFRLANKGTITLHPCMSPSQKTASFAYRVEESAQLIYPLKYMEQMPVLCEIEKDCRAAKKSVLERVAKIYHDASLRKYIDALYDSGQMICDWDLNYFSVTEVDFSRYPELRNKPPEEQVRLQMILNAMNRAENIKRYRLKYSK